MWEVGVYTTHGPDRDGARTPRAARASEPRALTHNFVDFVFGAGIAIGRWDRVGIELGIDLYTRKPAF